MADEDYSAVERASAPTRSRPVHPLGSARRRGISAIPVLGDALATVRLLRDKAAPTWTKLLVLVVAAYVVFPLDAVPDLAPVIGWLDDAGLLIALRLLFHRRLAVYRYPLGELPPQRTEEMPSPTATCGSPSEVSKGGRSAPASLLSERAAAQDAFDAKSTSA